MVNGDLLCRIWCVLSVLGGVELRARKGIIEDTGDPDWDVITSYLDYEEPEYNQSKGFTADDFTDNLQGYQTQPSIAKSFGWETSGYGELPFAALLVNHQKTKYCMGTVVTVAAVVTPCGCVRRLGLESTHESIWNTYKFDENGGGGGDKYYYYDYDLGKDVDVIANHIEYIEDQVGRGVYPQIKSVVANECWESWGFKPKIPGDDGPDGFKRHQQLFHPAVVILTFNLEFDTPCPWPPFEFYYLHESVHEPGFDFFYKNPGDEGNPHSGIAGIVASYKFIPLEDTDLSMDSDAREVIKTKDRLVNFRVELCNQSFCNSSESFVKLNRYWSRTHELNSMLCWCDVPWLGDETIYQHLKDVEAPIYLKSVYGGLIGAPVIFKGLWMGWTVEKLTRSVSEGATRSTLTRNIDGQMIAFFEKVLPELKKPNRHIDRNPIGDLNRGSFAVHDLKEFVPDGGIHQDELDLQAWAQIGNPRFVKRKQRNRRRRGKSGASTVPPQVLSLLGGIFLIEAFRI